MRDKNAWRNLVTISSKSLSKESPAANLWVCKSCINSKAYWQFASIAEIELYINFYQIKKSVYFFTIFLIIAVIPGSFSLCRTSRFSSNFPIKTGSMLPSISKFYINSIYILVRIAPRVVWGTCLRGEQRREFSISCYPALGMKTRAFVTQMIMLSNQFSSSNWPVSCAFCIRKNKESHASFTEWMIVHWAWNVKS